MAAPTTTNEVTVRRLSEVLVGSDGNGGIKKAVDDKIAAAINALDVTSTGGAGKYISAISEQDGKISATATSMDTAPTASSTNAVTSGGIKTALDAKTDRIVWVAVTKGQTWSRIYKATPTINTVGCSGVLSIAATRGGVVCNITFLITSSHAGSNYVNIIELASCNYSAVRVRAVASGSGDYYLELYDTSNSIAAGTAQTWNCRYIPVLEATVTTYTAFTDGTTIPSGYSAVNDFTTTTGSSAAAIKNITRSGTTFTATRQDGSTFTFTQQDSNTDTLVKATAKTDNVNYKILATASSSPTSGSATEAVYDADITLNPSTNTIAANISGDAATASAAKSGSTLATTIAGKQDKLTEQTAYTSKGTATKVPQITTNSLGQVTKIEEVTITGVAPASHAHGNITNAGAIGTTSGNAVYTTTNGVLTAGSLATDDPTASGTTTTAIATISQDAKGKITVTKKTISGVTPASHTHGNITNAGALQTNDVTIASGDKLVITDSSDSNKVARASISFDGSTTTKALTQKGTFEAFAKASDITSAIQALDVSSVGGAGKYISAISETDGKISATATSMDTTPTASSTNAVTSGGVAIALTGYKPVQTAKSSPSASGNTLAFIDTISQDANGVITATKKNVTVDSSLSTTSTNPVQNKVVQSALDKKIKWTTDPSEIKSTGELQCYVDYGSYNDAYILFYDVTSAFNGSFDRSGDQSAVAFAGFVESCKFNGYGENQFYKVECKVNGRYPSNNNYSTSKSYGPVVLKRTYTESGIQKISYYLAIKVPANYNYGLVFFGRFHCHVVSSECSETISWSSGFLGTRVPDTSTEYEVHWSWSAGYNTAASLFTPRQLAVNLANTSTTTTFDGSANQTGIKVSGTLSVANGGTGATTWNAASYNLFKNTPTETTDVTDNAELVFQYVEPTTATGAFYNRKAPKLWAYIKGKLSSDSGVNISGNAATATTASKLGTANLGSSAKPIYLASGVATECSSYAGGTAVTLNNASKAASTASFYAPTSGGTAGYVLTGNGATAAPVWSQKVAIANGGTNATTASGARTNLDVYSKSEVDSMLTGRISVVTSLPATGEAGVIYFVGPSGSGSDQYEEYVWDGSAFIKVGEKSLDLSNYVNTLSSSGSGSVVTGLSKSGNTLTYTKGNISINNLSDWASNSDVTISSTTYHTWWPTAPTASNQVYGLSIYNGRLYRIYNNKGTYSALAYDTDHTYSNASLGQGYGTCSTAAGTTAKAVTMSNYELVTGGVVVIKFTNALCASATLSINSKTAKPVYIKGAAVTAANAGAVAAGDTATFFYDGTAYHLIDTDRAATNPIVNITRSGTTFTATRLDGSTFTFTQQDNNTTYTQETLGQGYGTCTTAEATAAKEVSLTNYELVKNGIIAVKFSYGLCASATLNVNSKGAKPIYIQGAAVSSTTAKEVLAGDIALFMYDGTQYQFLCSDRLSKDAITGLSASGKTITYTKADGTTGTLTTQDTTYTFDGTYNASTNKAATVSTVTNKIAALDVSDISGFGAGKTLATLTETDGKIAATFQNISITKSQVSDFPTSMTPTSHAHGNIANGGTLTDTAAAAAGNDYVVIRDADNSKIQTSTIKGTDVADAVNKKHSHSTLTLSTTAQAYDGTHTLALPASDPYTSARTPTSHTHGNITNAGAIGSTSGYAVYTTTNGVLTAGTLATSDPTASGNTLSFIDTISQDAKGKITATKKSVTIDTALSSTSTNPVQNKVVNTALAGKQNTLTEMTEQEVDDLLASLT